jgi:protein-tyrosine kinase
MVNTRILEKQAGWRRNAPEAGNAVQSPRALGHEPVLQGRISTGSRDPLPGAPGLLAPRGRLTRAVIDDTWASLDIVADRLESAVARQGALPPIESGSAAAVAMDQLRGQMLRVAGARGWRRIGISAPRRGSGASFLTLGLAASVARLDYLRLAVIDLDLSQPGLHHLLGLTPPGPLANVLHADVVPVSQAQRVGENLALVLNGSAVPAAAELLHSPEAILALRALSDCLQPDLLLVDLPPLLGDAVAQAALPQVDAVLLVADGTRTTARDIAECERILDGQVPLLGVVLNKSEDRPVPVARG